MKKLLLTISLVICSLLGSLAQTPLQFTQVFKTLEFVNPAYSAFEGSLSGKMMYRSQWAGMDGAPKTMGFTAYSPLSNYKLGVGIQGINVSSGNMNLSNLAATFNVDLRVNETDFLAFGLQAGGEYSFFDRDKLISYYDIDATSIGGMGYAAIDQYSFFNPTFGTGIIYYNPKFYAGISSFMMINQNKFVAQDFYQGSYLMAGLTQNIGLDWYLKETMMYKWLYRDRNIGELGLYLMYKDLFWVGTSHRYLESQSVIMDVKLTETLRIGMSYDIQLSQLKRYTYGSFEFRLEYRGFSKYRYMNSRKKRFNEF
ncbi:PorP/SprF family type IX secretion system membrane protein [Saccharicrinis sp. FJH54]|uniref:PorP/SprF family type IX secretion system membrane protein n=1 Tax=Saccharicrinis sp. FJH54 TaxID=3344665 RepID=UPI0035D511B3